MDTEEAKKIIKEAQDRINALITEERWQDAHRACLEVLRFDPQNIKFIRLKNKIEKNVLNINRKSLKGDLKNLEPLWKQGKFDELMLYVKKLEPFANDYAPLKKFIVKVKVAYMRKMASEQEKYLNDEITGIGKLITEHKYQDALRIAEKLRILRLRETELKKLIANIRSKWIDYSIESNKTLLESEKYEDILLFYQGLLRIDFGSTKVKKLIESTKKSYQFYKIRQKKEYIYKQIERIKTLYQLKKYELALETAREILDIEPSNKEAKFYFVKARKKAQKKQDQEIAVQMKASRNQMKEEYRKNKKDFLKI
jgi:hypothetical protein